MLEKKSLTVAAATRPSFVFIYWRTLLSVVFACLPHSWPFTTDLYLQFIRDKKEKLLHIYWSIYSEATTKTFQETIVLVQMVKTELANDIGSLSLTLITSWWMNNKEKKKSCFQRQGYVSSSPAAPDGGHKGDKDWQKAGEGDTEKCGARTWRRKRWRRGRQRGERREKQIEKQDKEGNTWDVELAWRNRNKSRCRWNVWNERRGEVRTMEGRCGERQGGVAQPSITEGRLL